MDEWTKTLIKIKKATNAVKYKCPIENALFSSDFRLKCKRFLSQNRTQYDSLHKYLLDEMQYFLLNNNVMVKPSDKNSGLVVFFYDDYKKEVKRQLEDLARYNINVLFDSKDKKRLKSIIPFQYKPAKFYILPKIHKKYTNFPLGRPISSTINTINRAFSMILDAILRPLCLCIPNLIIDSTHLLLLLKNLQLNPEKKYMLLASDIVSMYQMLPIEVCKQNCIKYFNLHAHKPG